MNTAVQLHTRKYIFYVENIILRNITLRNTLHYIY